MEHGYGLGLCVWLLRNGHQGNPCPPHPRSWHRFRPPPRFGFRWKQTRIISTYLDILELYDLSGNYEKDRKSFNSRMWRTSPPQSFRSRPWQLGSKTIGMDIFKFIWFQLISYGICDISYIQLIPVSILHWMIWQQSYLILFVSSFKLLQALELWCHVVPVNRQWSKANKDKMTSKDPWKTNTAWSLRIMVPEWQVGLSLQKIQKARMKPVHLQHTTSIPLAYH